MSIGLTEEHQALADSVRGFAGRHITTAVIRQAVDDETEARPVFWGALAEQELLGLHLPEKHGGQGFSLVELAIAIEEMGRALAPGPYVPTVLASAVLAAADVPGIHEQFLPDLASGVRAGAVAIQGAGVSTLTGTAREDGDGWTLTGTIGPVMGGLPADLFVVPFRDIRGDERWAVVPVGPGVSATPLEGLDVVRGVASVAFNEVVVPAERILAGLTGQAVRDLAAVIFSAEASGIAGWCVDTAAAYAGDRHQFGRPIGQFQGIKHKCARMLIEVERARAVTWDAARAQGEERHYAALVAGVIAPGAAVQCAQDLIQVLGGIGYTWEHDAHLYYRRALTLRALLGRGGAAAAGGLALSGVRPRLGVELPAEAEPVRQEIRARVAELAELGEPERRERLAAEGWVRPHLPEPWGRNASPLEQVVIDQEFRRASVRPTDLMIGSWVVPSLVGHGTREQQERFLPPTLRGEMIWCQLFSEPGAGSDLAGLSTKAVRADGGWRISGQKVWNSLAREAQWAICLARTDPNVPKHEGITYFLVDMSSPGIDVRPLREITGDAIFNEVFLEDVFVPDDLVVGEVGAGWRVARDTLANERVGLSSGWSFGAEFGELTELVKTVQAVDDPLVRDRVGQLACADHAFRLLGLRATLKQVAHADMGATASVRKLVGMEHGQRIAEYGFTLLEAEGATIGEWSDERLSKWPRVLLATRAMTIGGGTTEVNLNVIAERLLGLPRDP